MVNDLVGESRRRLREAAPASADAVRRHGAPLIGFSVAMRRNDRAIKDFLFAHMYRHYRVNRMTSKARRLVGDLFRLLVSEPNCLPPDWQRQAGPPDSEQTARLVADYIAGMTDRFAHEEHRRLFDLQATG